MRQQYYSYAPLILTVLGILMAVTGYLVEVLVRHSDGLVWQWFIPVQALAGFACGRLIRNFYWGAYLDPLTQVWNRRYFEECLPAKCRKMQNAGTPFCIAMIDADDFKKVNDRYGHPAGDTVLKRLARILQQNTRVQDVVVRLSGDEFAIVFPGTAMDGAYVVAERIRTCVESNLAAYQVTVSIGIVPVAGVEDLYKLLVKADQALYTAKINKNLVAAAN